MPFLSQFSHFILAWDRHQICWLAYPVAWLTTQVAISVKCMVSNNEVIHRHCLHDVHNFLDLNGTLCHQSTGLSSMMTGVNPTGHQNFFEILHVNYAMHVYSHATTSWCFLIPLQTGFTALLLLFLFVDKYDMKMVQVTPLTGSLASSPYPNVPVADVF